MKIDLVLTACDMNDHYLRLLPHVFKTWKAKFGLDCNVVLIGTEIPDFLKEYGENIILFDPIPGIHTAFIAQVIRILYPCIYDNKNILITDADIIPISKAYFIDSVEKLNNDAFICYRDAYLKQKMLAICYSIANASTWKDVFGINSLDDIRTTIKNWYNPKYTGAKNCDGWFTDQQKLFEHIMNWKNKTDRLVILRDPDIKFKRLDKRQRVYIINNLDKVKTDILNGVYSDFHVIRPFNSYKSIIDSLVDIIIKS